MSTERAATNLGARAIARLALMMTVVFLLGAMLVPHADATKKGASVANRIQSQVDLCETIGHGILTVETVGKDKVTQCTGGLSDGQRCVHSKKGTKCHQAKVVPPSSGNDSVSVPVSGIGVAEQPPTDPGAPPSAPPSDAPFLE
jgi:hypothetical protein